MVKNRNFGQKSKFWSKIEIMRMSSFKNWQSSVGQNKKLGSKSTKINILAIKIKTFEQKIEV